MSKWATFCMFQLRKVYCLRKWSKRSVFAARRLTCHVYEGSVFCSSAMTRVLCCGQMFSYGFFFGGGRSFSKTISVWKVGEDDIIWGFVRKKCPSVSRVGEHEVMQQCVSKVSHTRYEARFESNHRCSFLNFPQSSSTCSAFLVSRKNWRLFIVCLSLFCWLNWTANQSCFSSLSLRFRFATEGGRCLECSLQRHVCCRSQRRNGAKTGRNASSKGFGQSDVCCFPLPTSLLAAIKLLVNLHPIYIYFFFAKKLDRFVEMNRIKVNSLANKNNVASLEMLPPLAAAVCNNTHVCQKSCRLKHNASLFLANRASYK